jgi:hypothetical protein
MRRREREKKTPKSFASWISAARKLNKEDHYISVMVDHAGVSTGPVSDSWNGAAIGVMVVFVFVAMKPILYLIGLATPRAGAQFGSYTVDESLSNFVGYAWLCISSLVVCGLAFSHFARKRKMYRMFDRLLTAALRLFGPRKEV